MNATQKKIIGAVSLGLVILIVLGAVVSAILDQWNDGGPNGVGELQPLPPEAIAEP